MQDEELSRSVQIGLRVSLARRFFTEDLEFINTAKNYIEIGDFYELVNHIISPPASHGKLGGKSAGMLLASQIIRKCGEYSDLLADIKVPKTWYIASDGLMSFVEYNQLEDVYNRKYLEIEQIRREYPHIVQVFKNSRFAPEIMKGLSLALDDLEGRPLIVRSSSLLEDRMGAAFSGKYKSLFLANVGTKGERLSALMDAIAEVYASLFGADPIEYRAERNLLDLHEEMGIMIQEVVGTRVGPYFLPSFAGVAFSNNEFRWSPRIKREDGLVRLVPGLGTRAVDRVGDDYPILVAPGQPGLRVNVTPDEILRYAPRKIDVINLETQRFETIDAGELFREYGRELPGARPDRVGLRQRGHPPAGRVRLGPGRVAHRRHLRRPDHQHAVHGQDADAAQAAARAHRVAGGHRVRLRRPRPLPAAVPAAELLAATRCRRPSRATCRTTACCSRPTATSRTAASPTSPTSSTWIPSSTTGSRASTR